MGYNKECFDNEVEALRTIQSPNIPKLYDAWIFEDSYYIVEEYIEGSSIYTLVDQNGVIDTDEIINISISLCTILESIHTQNTGRLYLDIQPKNVIVRDGEIYLVDFGSSRRTDLVTSVYGTIGFCAPEQILNKNAINEETDIYGMGALMYFMLTGQVYNGFIKDDTNASDKLLDIVRQCLTEKPDSRYSSIVILRSQLVELRDSNVFDLINNLDNKKTKQNIKQNKMLDRGDYSNNNTQIINIYGTHNRVGTTLLSLGLASYLKSKNMEVIYKENNNHCDVSNILEDCKDSKLSQGMVDYKKLFLLPKYDDCVDMSLDNLIIVNDCGCVDEDETTVFDNNAFSILIAGIRDWELRKTKEIFQRFNLAISTKKVVYNFAKDNDVIRANHDLGTNGIRMPYIYDFNIMNSNQKRFFERVLDISTKKKSKIGEFFDRFKK